MTTLRLRAFQGADEIGSFRRGPTGIVILERAASEPVRRDLQRWLDNGFTEFLGPGGNRQPRSTQPNDPDLLERIADYLRRHGFDVRMDVAATTYVDVSRQLRDLSNAARFLPADAANVGSRTEIGTPYVLATGSRASLAIPTSIEFGAR